MVPVLKSRDSRGERREKGCEDASSGGEIAAEAQVREEKKQASRNPGIAKASEGTSSRGDSGEVSPVAYEVPPRLARESRAKSRVQE